MKSGRYTFPARIVNLPSVRSSLTLNGDLVSLYYATCLISHSKFSESRYVKTDLTEHNGFLTAEEAPKLPAKDALLATTIPFRHFCQTERGLRRDRSLERKRLAIRICALLHYLRATYAYSHRIQHDKCDSQAFAH